MKKYVFSNGTMSELFQDQWCCKCERDKAISSCWDNKKQQYTKEPQWQDGCQILARAISCNGEEENYPEEIRYCLDMPVCVAFIETELKH